MGGRLSASTMLHVMLFNKLLKHSFFFSTVFPGNVKILIWIDLSQQLPHFIKEQTRNPSQIPTMPFSAASNPSLSITQWLIFSVAPIPPSSVNCHFHDREVADEVRSWYEKVCGGLGFSFLTEWVHDPGWAQVHIASRVAHWQLTEFSFGPHHRSIKRGLIILSEV